LSWSISIFATAPGNSEPETGFFLDEVQ